MTVEKHDPFTDPCPKGEPPYHLEDSVLRTDDRDAIHVKKMKKLEDLHRAANTHDPTQRPWKQNNPFYLEGVTAEKPK